MKIAPSVMCEKLMEADNTTRRTLPVDFTMDHQCEGLMEPNVHRQKSILSSMHSSGAIILNVSIPQVIASGLCSDSGALDHRPGSQPGCWHSEKAVAESRP